jgi:hypothetical protein
MICFLNAAKPSQSATTVIGYKAAGPVAISLLPFWRAILFVGFIFFFGCSSSTPGPLSIKMFNPKTQSTLVCAANDNRGGDTSALAAIVESCARQLESRGFVRAN